MSKFYQIAEKKGHQLIHSHTLIKLIENLYEGKYLVSYQLLSPQSDIKDYRRCYFAKIQALGDENGETKHSMHEIVRDEILDKMLKETPEVFIDGSASSLSTNSLTLEGWLVLLERLDLWAFMEYGTILQ
jgi:hypothetical protein